MDNAQLDEIMGKSDKKSKYEKNATQDLKGIIKKVSKKKKRKNKNQKLKTKSTEN